jgi:K+-sensing histidine kinase KdpD
MASEATTRPSTPHRASATHGRGVRRPEAEAGPDAPGRTPPGSAATDRERPGGDPGAPPEGVQVCADLDFLTMVSHELRHAAGVISGFLDLVVTRGEILDERQTRHLLVRARDNAHRMNRLLEDVSVAMRLGSGAFSYALRPVDLRRVVRQTSAQLAQTMGREVHVEQPDGMPAVLADRDRQVQILTNLLSNAMKYSPPDSPIWVEAEPREGEVVVSVHNHGASPTSTELENVFEPFIRLEEHDGSQEGLGLGLYITRLLVEGQGGRIRAHHGESQGWTFTYTVPIASSDQVGDQRV